MIDPTVCTFAAAATAAVLWQPGRPLSQSTPSLGVGGREVELGLVSLQGWLGTAEATVRAAVQLRVPQLWGHLGEGLLIEGMNGVLGLWAGKLADEAEGTGLLEDLGRRG